MNKRLVFLLVTAMILSFTACSKRNDSEAPDQSKSDIIQEEAIQDSLASNETDTSEGNEAEIENQIDLSLDDTHYETDAQIAVTLDFNKLNQDQAIIVVVSSDTEHNKTISYDNDASWIEYRWLSDFSELPFYLFPENMSNGLYDVRVYADAESGTELASITMAVGSAVLPTGNENADNTGTVITSSNISEQGGIPAEGGDCTKRQMEDTIVSYLSKISGLSSLSLGGGSRIEYTKTDDALNECDIWTIYDPELNNDNLYDTMNSQLAAAGFTYEKDMVGRHVWYMDIDGEHKGILFWPDDDELPDGYYLLMMTHGPDEY